MMRSLANRMHRLLLFLLPALLHAAVTGSLSGTVQDATGAVIPNAAVTVTNVAQGIQTKTTSNAKGAYAFPSLAVGQYDLNVDAGGFKPEKRTGIVVDTDSAIQVDISLTVAERREEVTVSDSAEQVHVETVSTQKGEVVTGAQMTAVALNGRSFTDLLALQPGIVPTSSARRRITCC